MYCPKCNQYYRKKYGTLLSCACGYHFVFGHNDSIKDHFMLMLEKKASKNETRYFTMDDLYTVYQKYEANRSSALAKFFFFRKTQMLSKDVLAQIHYHWQRASSLKSNKFIEKPSLQQPENPIGEEAFLYGVERIIVVDEPLQVDLFVKNNKHIDKKALIISSEGYPAYLKPQLQTILQRQPNIKIGFLHKPETTIDEQFMRFEQNYQVKLPDKPLWDISANQKYTKKAKLEQADKSKEDLQTIPSSITDKSKKNLQIVPLSREETPSKEGQSWLSRLISSSTTSSATVASASLISSSATSSATVAAANLEEETVNNEPEIEMNSTGVDTNNSSEMDSMANSGEDSSFGSVNDNESDGIDDTSSGFSEDSGFDSADDGGFDGVDDGSDSDDGGDSGDGDGGDGDGE